MPSLGQEKKSIKAVLDTNVLISAYLFSKRLGTIADLIQQDKVVPCFITSTLAELEEVLAYPKFLATIKSNQTTPEHIFKTIRNKSVTLPDPVKIPLLVSDVFDNYILASAGAHKVNYLVTGDQLVLKLKRFQNIPIITPRNF